MKCPAPGVLVSPFADRCILHLAARTAQAVRSHNLRRPKFDDLVMRRATSGTTWIARRET